MKGTRHCQKEFVPDVFCRQILRASHFVQGLLNSELAVLKQTIEPLSHRAIGSLRKIIL